MGRSEHIIRINHSRELRGQSARYIAHLLPNFSGTRVKSKTTDGKSRSKFTVFARVFELRLQPPMLLHRNQFRLYATLSALESPGTPICVLGGQVPSFLLVRERKHVCPLLSASGALPRAPFVLCQRAGVCVLQSPTVSRKHFALQFACKSVLGGNKF